MILQKAAPLPFRIRKRYVTHLSLSGMNPGVHFYIIMEWLKAIKLVLKEIILALKCEKT
jgi:hypothetical protein